VRPDVECGICLMHWVYSRVAPHTEKEAVSHMTEHLLGTLFREVVPEVNLGTLCNSAVWSVFSVPSAAASHYEELKRQSNKNAEAILPLARAFIEAGRTEQEKLERACSLAAASNVAPLNSPSGAYTFQEIKGIIEGTEDTPVVIGDVYGAVSKAKHILYITDNAGEIGFDSLVIDLITRMGPKITLVVKEKTYFEDATPEDATYFGLPEKVDRMVLAQGFFAPSEVSEGLYGILAESDLLLVKGTGSYEALSGETHGRNAVFMLKVKCDPIARDTGLSKGKVVVRLDQDPGEATNKT
jgi:damage-control phosphatase, subfamily I